VAEEKKEEKSEEKKKEEEKPEPEFELLSNPARVTRSQLNHITFDVDPRYIPIRAGVHGIIMLKDTKPEEQENIIEGSVPSIGNTQDEEDEPQAPEPFLYLG